MRKTRGTLLGTTTFALRVDSYSDGQMQGVVGGVLISEPTEFKSLPQLIMMLDELMDQDNSIRAGVPKPSAFLPTLELEILFRHNYSWQGNIRQLESGRVIAFRSVLELIIAFDTMLNA